MPCNPAWSASTRLQFRPRNRRSAASRKPVTAAVIVKPGAPSKAIATDTIGTPASTRAEKNAAAANAPADAVRPTRLGNEMHRKPGASAAASAAQLRRMVEEERARRWASQHD